MRIGKIKPQSTDSFQFDTWVKQDELNLAMPTSGTKLLCHFEGTDTSTTMLDASGTDKQITANGTAQIDTAQYKFGSASLLLDGNSDYLTIPDSADWDIVGNNADNWTVETFIRLNSYGTQYIITHYEDASNKWILYHTSANGIKFAASGSPGAGWIELSDSSNPISDSNWHHIALCKVGQAYGLYLDGTQVAYASSSSTDTFSGSLYIGQSAAGSAYVDGWLDELRIINANPYSASPNVGKTDTITVPTSAHTGDDPVSSVTFSGLDGNKDVEYELLTFVKQSGSGASNIHLKLNSDSTAANYVYQYLSASGTSKSSARGTRAGALIGYTNASTRVNFSKTLISAESGNIRLIDSCWVGDVNGVTIGWIGHESTLWKNSDDTLSSITVDPIQSIGTGSNIILYKRVTR